MQFTEEEIQRIKEFTNDLYKGSDLYKKVVTNVCILTGNEIHQVLKKNQKSGNAYCHRLISYALYSKGITENAIAKMQGCQSRMVKIQIKKIKMEIDVNEHVSNHVKSLLRSL